MALLDLTNPEKVFGTNRVVKDFNQGMDKGEFVSLLGPSGCGKTTVLRMVAWFETPTSGSILIDGQDVSGRRTNQRAIGMIFQAYALFPNMTVADNVAFGLKVKGVPKAEREARLRPSGSRDTRGNLSSLSTWRGSPPKFSLCVRFQLQADDLPLLSASEPSCLQQGRTAGEAQTAACNESVKSFTSW